MKSVKIIAKSTRGENALRKGYSEKATLAQRLAFKAQGFKQEVTSENPFIVEITINSKTIQQLVNLRDMHYLITRTMRENNAIEDIDYIVIGE